MNTALQVATGQYMCHCRASSPDGADPECVSCGGTGWEKHDIKLKRAALQFLELARIEQKVSMKLLRLQADNKS